MPPDRASLAGLPEHQAAPYDFRKSLQHKGLILGGLLALAAVAFAIVYRYFYILDAYIYTGEFHLLFITNNLTAGKVELFNEYLKPMSALFALPICLTSACYSGMVFPATDRVLIEATAAAFGAPQTVFFGLAGFLLLGAMSYGAGALLFGDIMPFLRRGAYGEYLLRITTPAAIIFPLGYAIPWLPIAYLAAGGAFFKVPFNKMLQLMLIGFTVRIFWLLVTPA